MGGLGSGKKGWRKSPEKLILQMKQSMTIYKRKSTLLKKRMRIVCMADFL
jgi:hypothetical protein